MTRLARLPAVVTLTFLLAALGACKSAPPVKPDYSRPLPPGASALRKVSDPALWSALRTAFDGRDAGAFEAADRSEAWFNMPSSRQFYPLQPLGITHDQAHASIVAFRQLLASSTNAAEFEKKIRSEMDAYASVGWNSEGVVLFTGYYTPIFTASRIKTAEYRYPLYPKPADLWVDPANPMHTLRDRGGGRMEPYPTRAQIEAYPDRLGLAGHEVAWLKDRFEAYVVTVQGSARLNLTDGTTMDVGYAGSNGLEYTPIAPFLVKDGKMDPDHLNLQAMIAHFKDHPEDLDNYLPKNERYIFFKDYSNQQWPAGSLGFKVTPQRSLATDKTIFPRACPTLVDTKVPDAHAGAPNATRPVCQFMFDQDTGGAIRAPGRADMYYGVGDAAGDLAGRQFAEGRLYYLLLKPERVAYWLWKPGPTAAPPGAGAGVK